MKDYPFVCPIQVRWRDLDAFAHVNNATFASYLEMARTEVWRQRFNNHKATDIPFYVRRLEIDYLRPLSLYDEVKVGLRVGTIKGATFTFEYLVEAGGEPVAKAVTRLACVDKETGKPTRVPPALRDTLETLQVD